MGRSEHRGSPSASSSSSGHVFSSISFVVRAKSALSWRRNNQVASMENSHEQELEDLNEFQRHVSDRLLALAAEPSLFTLASLQKVLEAFVAVEEEFRVLVLLLMARRGKSEDQGNLQEFLSGSVKALDVCNAVSQALDSLEFCYKQAEIAAAALAATQRGRARRALVKLNSLLVLERGYSSERSSSSGGSSGLRRGISLNVYDNWSAAKQVQGMGVPPRAAEGSAMAGAVQTMGAVNAFVMWVLVAAFSPPGSVVAGLPRQGVSAAVAAMQERAAEEVRRERRAAGVPGMLAELQVMAKCGAAAELEGEVVGEELGGELAAACRAMEEGIGPLRQQVREIFHRLVLSRAEIMDYL